MPICYGFRFMPSHSESARDVVREALEMKRRGEYAAAAARFENAIEQHGSSSFLLANLGHCFLLAGNTSEARRALNDALKVDRANVFALCFLARVAEQEGRPTEQIELLEEALRLKPEDANVRKAIVWGLVKTGRARAALPHVQWLKAHAADDPASLKAVAATLRAARGAGDAREASTTLVAKHPADGCAPNAPLETSGADDAARPAGVRLDRALNNSAPRADPPPSPIEALKQYFGFGSFRPGQEDVVRHVLAGRSTLAVMPTGRGKSLCFQLPALMQDGLTVVISPLIALMKDQVDELNRRNIPAAALNSSLTGGEQALLIDRLAAGSFKFLYVAPERFRAGSFIELLPKLRPALLVVDEAHCISQWGHDFRPDYLRLKKAIAALGSPQVIALTATATPDVQSDIITQLGARGMDRFVAGFERPNLSFGITHVGSDRDRVERLLDLVQEIEGPAIVYTASRKATREVADILLKHGVSATTYHAGLDHDERIGAQEAFMRGSIRVIVATNAFGMGIDKADIRLIVHYQMPGSLEAYYQEAGRAGRDGKPSRCELLFSYADKRIHEFFIDGSNPAPRIIRAIYDRIVRFGRDVIEMSAHEIGAGFDNVSDMQIASALAILERMELIERRSTGTSPATLEILDAFAGKRPSERAAIRHRLWTWIDTSSGRGKRTHIELFPEAVAHELSLDADQLSRALKALHDDGLVRFIPPFRGRAIEIRKRMDANALPIDERALAEKRRRDEQKMEDMIGYAYSTGCRQMQLIAYFGAASARCGTCDICVGAVKTRSKAKGLLRGTRSSPAKSRKTAAPGSHLFNKLRQWRLARAQGQPAFTVLSDRALHSIVAARPTSLDELRECHGIGPTKADKYGMEILAVLKGAVDE